MHSKVGAIDERVCLACGKVLVRREKESTADWLSRNSCGQATNCSAKLIAIRKQQKPASLGLSVGGACKTCGAALVKLSSESYRDFSRRQTCGGICSPHGVAHAREARELGLSIEEYLAMRRAQQKPAPPPEPVPDTRTEMQKLRDKWAARLLEPDPDATTRMYRTIAGAKGKALGMGRYNGRRASV